MNINLNKDELKFCIVGSGITCTVFADLLRKHQLPDPIFITWEKSLHKRDKSILQNEKEYQDIFEYCEKNYICIHQAFDINDIETINFIKSSKVKIIISLSSRWIFKDDIINLFDGKIFNLHHGLLPLERGGAIYPRIMNGNNILSASLHKLEAGIDTGNILYTRSQKAPEKYTIAEANSINLQISTKILSQFLKDLVNNNEIKETIQDIDDGIYMPIFHTETNGAIDWQWNAYEIEKFIRAFGRPFPGAFTFCRGKKVSILEAHVQKSDTEYHPYFYGRIATINKNKSIKIITKKDYLVVNKIVIEDFEGKPGEIIKLSSNAVFHTPTNILEKAKTTFIPSLKMKPTS